jgi:glycosyltransferase involved in cell wall biosynthesis
LGDKEEPRKRIAILSSYPADHVTFTGGVETATAALLEGLRAYQDEFEFQIVSVSSLIHMDIHEQRDGFWFHFLGVPHNPWVRPRFPLRVVKAYRTLQRIEPDLVHCQDNMALALAAIWSRCPRLFTIHGVKRHEASKRAGWERWSATVDAWIEPYVYQQFDDFVCISNYAQAVIGNEKRTYMIPNAVRSAFFEIRRKASLYPPILLFMGLLSPLKGLTDLILAHQQLRGCFPNLETVLCGGAENHGYVRGLQAAAGDGVYFLGHMGSEGLMDWLSRANVLVLPSRQENAPVVIAEAMAAGVPVVATRVGGVPGMVDERRTGLLYDPGDLDGLTLALKRILEDDQLARTMGQEARQQALVQYHPSAVARKTAGVYRVLLNDAPGRTTKCAC